MSTPPPLVSVGLPVRNSEEVIEGALRSILAQRHEDLELVISDNASTDGTEEICRSYARSDSRVRYHRQPENIDGLANAVQVMHLARGTFLKWIGDDDWLAPSYLSRCLERLAEDDRLILVTTQQVFLGEDGQAQTSAYPGRDLSSDRPVERFTEILRLLAEGYLPLDPIYGLMRREPVAAIPRRTMLREDEVFAAKLALAGPWDQVPEVLAHRGWKIPAHVTQRAGQLDVPAWQSRAASLPQCRELLAYLHQVPLTPAEEQAARAEVRRLYVRSHQRTAMRGYHKLMGFVRFGTALTTTKAG
ncbi:MAG: glycosyltransferase family 2 protein [Pseudonocardiaceae bacterium]